MAKYYADGNYVEVQKGDTLSAIARDYKSKSGGATYQQLAKINNISNPNKIYIGQKIKLTSSSSTGGGGSTAAKKKDPNITHFGLDAYEEKKLFATWTWSKESQTEKYKCEWTYTTDNKNWFTGQSQDNTVDEDARERSRISEYTIPAGAKQVRFRVKPISKKKTENGKDDSVHWTASWSEYKTWTVEKPLDAPATPSVKIELNTPGDITSGWKLTASLSNINIVGATHIVFEVVKDNKSSAFSTSKTIQIVSTDASYSCRIDVGSEYKVRAKAYNSSTKKESKWSDFSDNEQTVPVAPSGITTVRGHASRTIYLEWKKVKLATSYEIEYATEEYLFDLSGQTTTVSTETSDPKFYVSDVDPGFEYFFRVRAVNEAGESAWSPITSVVFGNAPSAPTTWSSTTTAVNNEAIHLYWVHNSEDNSDWTKAEAEFVVENTGYEAVTYTISDITNRTYDADETTDKTSFITIADGEIRHTVYEQYKVIYNASSDTYTLTNELVNPKLRGVVVPAAFVYVNDKKYKVCSYTTNGTTTYYADIEVEQSQTSQLIKKGAKIRWRVRTCGIKEDLWSDWSIERTITIYQQPYLVLKVRDSSDDALGINGVITSFPFYIDGIAYPENQTPLSYNITITANEPYETVDAVGNPRFVNAGDVVYSKYIDDYSNFKIELSPGNIDLENSISYTVNATVAMNSGLTGTNDPEEPITFTVSWDEPEYTPNAELSFDPETMTTTIRPYCDTTTIKYRKVREEGATYRKGSQVTSDINKVDGIEIPRAAITIGEQAYPVYRGIIIADGTQLYYCIVDGVVYKVTMSNGKYVWDNDESDKPQYLEEDTMYGERVQGATVDGYPVYMGQTTAVVEFDSNTETATVKTPAQFVYYCEIPETVRAEYESDVRYIVELVEDAYVFTGLTITTELDDRVNEDAPHIIDGREYMLYGYKPTEDTDYIYYVKIPTVQSRVYLSVYRREFDGSFTELASYLDGTNNTAITDPHPALDYARYRIVAIDKVTGGVSYVDLPGYPIGGKAIVIQWDEDWTTFDTTGEDALVQPPWQGSMLQLTYNIDVSESTDPEVELIEYIGRADPVAYYGTQRRQTASWNAVVPKSDKETIYGLRRLANWLGDVYVREPSGVGYWAHITVSFNQTHCDPSVPVTLTITRVEGGA